MKDPATSLDLLHDIVVPPPVPFWPPAPGWHALFALAGCALAVFAWRCWSRWRANAYRRAALEALASTKNVAGVSVLLRRVALAVEPRTTIAGLTGAGWPQWLASRYPEHPMPMRVHEQLAIGAYLPQADDDLATLQSYAKQWITGHHIPLPDPRTDLSTP